MSVINRVIGGPPRPGNRLSVARLGATESWDLTEVWEMSGRVAAHLRHLGVRPGDRIGVLAANSLEWVLLDLAALRIKAVTAGFDPGKFDATGAELVARYGLTALFTDQGETADRVHPVSALRELPPPDADLPTVSWEPHEAPALKFTSGSSGPAKSLLASAGSIDSSLAAVQDMFAHGPGDDLFVFLPLSLLQQRYWVYSAIVFGHDITISTYEAAFAALRTARPTVVMGVPGFYEAARSHLEARTARTGAAPARAATEVFGDRIRYLWTGSAPANPATLRYLTDAGLPIFEGYGLNETCIVAKNHPGAQRPGSVGRVLPGKEVLIDADGVINVRSEQPVATRYEHAEPGDSEKMFRPGGIVRTGDLGHLDEDGYLFVHGRADDMIVLENGKKIAVRRIEERLKADPAIEDCVVTNPSQRQLVAIVSPAAHPADTALIAAALRQANAALDHDEQIAKAVLAERFTVDNGLLSSQFKPRRKQIEAQYRRLVVDPEEGIRA
ncbi:AMP-dependent synthetase [Streptomyces ipomoeae]|uniref:AMP-dependent synthetase n=1 Tax=Streptomyces ipomoeae TaxID=103232 RepID=A0AAE9B2A9_9ACTN|nr:AMP-binding protein [Streptomyces ipomoeae]MDX2693334.1 AMP-binding protein [Streptomyces ipomoeae]MDX2820882.1 AMP-binding protein [Streptomyces ipomoeae]MDX2838967.1 AMP-binding protein [Streptomyces ipomoeae]MDX2873378.1 AMP-binding protein [Streptomyces ipomoeae]TQE38236.1 AMP-dependent synthetase [Streptomyces ipomoeae]